MQCFWTYFDTLFFLCVHELVSYFQGTKGNECLKLGTGELCVRERDDEHNHSIACSSQFAPLQLKNSSKKWKGTASAWGAREWKDQFFTEFIFYAEFEEKNGNEIFGRKTSSFQFSWEIGRNGAWTSCLEMPLLWGIRENFKGQIGAVMDDLWLWLFSGEEERMFLNSGSWKNLIKEGKEW